MLPNLLEALTHTRIKASVLEVGLIKQSESLRVERRLEVFKVECELQDLSVFDYYVSDTNVGRVLEIESSPFIPDEVTLWLLLEFVALLFDNK